MARADPRKADCLSLTTLWGSETQAVDIHTLRRGPQLRYHRILGHGTYPRLTFMAGKSLPPALTALATSQHGVVSRRALADQGVTCGQVGHQVRARRWQAYGPHAVVLCSGPLTFEQLAWIALINCGRQVGALAGATAATLQGLTGYASATMHLLVGNGARIAQSHGVVLHRTRRPLIEAVHPARRPRMTRLERSVVDAAVWARSDRDACALLAAAVQQRLTTPERLLEELGKATRVHRRQLLLLVLADIAGGVHSLAELDLGRLCRRYDLPQPLRQVVRVDSSGKRRYLDALMPFASGKVNFGIEIDGALHLVPLNYWDDMSRGNDLTIAGLPLLRFPAVALRLDPDAVMQQLLRMYFSR